MEPDYVFIDTANRPFHVRPWGDDGDWWMFYWHPDRRWVSLRKVSRGERKLTRAFAIPAKDAKLYHDAHAKGDSDE